MYSSPFQEHCEYVENAEADYQHELWASEIASMANEGLHDPWGYKDGLPIYLSDEPPHCTIYYDAHGNYTVGSLNLSFFETEAEEEKFLTTLD